MHMQQDGSNNLKYVKATHVIVTIMCSACLLNVLSSTEERGSSTSPVPVSDKQL